MKFHTIVLSILSTLLLWQCTGPQVQIELTTTTRPTTESATSTIRILLERLDALGIRGDVAYNDGAQSYTVTIPQKDITDVVRDALTSNTTVGFWDICDPKASPFDTYFNELQQLSQTEDSALTELFAPHSFQTAVFGNTRADLEQRKRMLVELRDFFPPNTVPMWDQGFVESDGRSIYSLYLLLSSPETNGPFISNRHIAETGAISDPYTNAPMVSIVFNNEGAQRFAEMTTKAAANNQHPIAIVVDGDLLNTPNVIEPILGGRSMISGDYTIEEALTLATTMGKELLPSELSITRETLREQ